MFRLLLQCLWVLIPVLLLVPGPLHASDSTSHQQQTGVNSGHGFPDDKGFFERRTALDISQAALGNALGSYKLQSSDSNWLNLADLKGKPLLISLIYTSCYHICPTTTRHLHKAVQEAASLFGRGGFNVLTIGFDTLRDSPPMMAQFREGLDIEDDNWHFLSADEASIQRISRELGFIFYSSPHGFDHLIQLSLMDREQRLVQQKIGRAHV